MPKYDPLERHLRGLDRATEHVMTFTQIEQIIGCPLPRSARLYQAWWANQRGHGHTQTHSWMNASWHTGDLDLKAGRVTFRPVALPREPKLPGLAATVVRPLTISQAKAGIALALRVNPDQIDITIRA